MQPTPLTEIQRRIDLPDPGRCTECKRVKHERVRETLRKRRRQARP
jgi:hypothetical protein